MPLDSHATAPVGVFGGTFDPVHFGHLRPALEVLQGCGLHEVRLIPCHVPPHRAMPQAGGDHRLELLRLAVAEVPGLVVDDRELRRPGRSFMVDTLASLRAELPATPLGLILGMDSFLSLPRWHRWRELTDYAHLIVMDRPGHNRPQGNELADWLEGRQAREPRDLGRSLAGQVLFHPVSQLDISATRIRGLIQGGLAPHFLLPATVWRRIAESGWYGWPAGATSTAN